MKRLLGITGLAALLFAVTVAVNQRSPQIEKPNLETKTDEEGVFELIGLISDSKGETYTRKTLLRFKGKPTKGEFKDFDNDGDPDFIFEGYIIENSRKIYGNFVSENDGKGNYLKPKLIKPAY